MPMNSTPVMPDDPSSVVPAAAFRRRRRQPRGYLLLEVIVSGVILATALVGAMVTTQKASNLMAEANRESQAGQVLAQAISTFLAHPYGTFPQSAWNGAGDNITLGDRFKCVRTFSFTDLPEVTHGANTLQVQTITITVTYNLPNGGQRAITSTARRYQLI